MVTCTLAFEQLFPNRGLQQNPNSLVFQAKQIGVLMNKFEVSFIGKSSASFRTHNLVAVSPHRVEFKPTKGNYVFWTIFILTPLVPLLSTAGEDWTMVLFTLPLFAAGLVGLNKTQRFVFDQISGKAFAKRLLHINQESSLPLHSIAAVQFLAGYAGENNAAEINLCLKDGTRHHLLTRNEQKTLRVDAEALAAFLRVPLTSLASS
ncbi:MAG TPA: hypothetical protein VE954_27610 [Oligoflexus sp.]|uniref:hypothetical protein n=1 Tax=Oligoflexus sp. TaxID=1971216 RepID=UPI002D5BFEB9|nr:hypothetical protein [Oligoflexus sp.]HYX36892.1 hypothetical protein [Oligoflexus sp.]